MMMYKSKLILSLGLLIGLIYHGFSQKDIGKLSLTVMSFNVRYDTPKDSINTWKNRKEKVAFVITSNNIDIAGLQEPWINQIDDLEGLLPAYAWIGWSRDNGKSRGEFVPIFYRRDRFSILKKGIFWLSETPEQVGSKGWDVKYPRIVVWARFKDKKTKREFFFFNTHLGGEKARFESAKLLRAKIDQMSEGLPTIVTGDFNDTPDSNTYAEMNATKYQRDLNDALSVARKKNEELFTNYLFDGNDQDLKRIDYIFVSSEVIVLDHEIINKRIGKYYPSDHLALKAELEF
ncbi:MAG: endonuclease/exonuclease/phosphatase family protein [Saprospiraceae bacterium]|nr:endonuclease/exonuclease/phosphatase family protein [Saprospiraceae bacterium]